MLISGATPSRRNLSAFEIRFWNSWRICSASALIVGSSPILIVAPASGDLDLEVLQDLARSARSAPRR